MEDVVDAVGEVLGDPVGERDDVGEERDVGLEGAAALGVGGEEAVELRATSPDDEDVVAGRERLGYGATDAVGAADDDDAAVGQGGWERSVDEVWFGG